MNRLKLFIENFFIYGSSRVIGKVIPLIMLPIITRLIPDTSIYGLADLLHIIISFGSAFALLGMYDAMFRFFFDDESFEFKKVICSNSLNVVLISSIISGITVIIFSKYIALHLLNSPGNWIWVVVAGIQLIALTVNTIVAAPTRMQNKRGIYVLINFLSPIVGYSTTIPLIIYVDPLSGLIIGGFIPIFLKLVFFSLLNKKWFNLRTFDKEKTREMLKIGIPIIPIFLIYWIFNSFDRIMISKMIGTDANGIYAVGAKLAMISQLIYIAFASGWQYFAFSTMNDKDQVQLTSKIFEYLGILSFLSIIFILPWIKIIYSVLIDVNYYSGYVVVPYLFLSPLLLMLFQTAGNQLLIIKKPLLSTISLFIGASLNVILNFLLIPFLGIEGAAIATLAGYSISVLLVVLLLLKKKLITISLRFNIGLILTLGFLVISRILLMNYWYSWLLVSIIVIFIITKLYYLDFYGLFKRLFIGRFSFL